VLLHNPDILSVIFLYICRKKSLKIPQGKLESVNRRQHNGQKKKDKVINNDLQNTTQKNKDRATQTPLKPGVNLGVTEGSAVLASLVAPVVDV